jgi:aminoglycoside/choline kinase family phosphotransferase
MSERVAEFLRGTGFANASSAPVAGDLSARRFDRLTQQGRSAILMDAGAGDTSTADFLRISTWLRDLGLSVPEIYAADPDQGLALLEDFGDAKLADLVRSTPSRQPGLYTSVLDALVILHDAPPLPLARPDATTLTDATALADDWYPGADPSALAEARAALAPVLSHVLDAPPRVSLRDFHAENILWLPDRPGRRAAGLIDYQDAFLIHPVYDLMSLATDARIDVPPTLRDDLFARFAAATDLKDARLAFDALAVQRNLRIIGIFARAARRDGKRQHLSALPRVWGYLTDALRNPALSAVRAPLLKGLPAPDATVTARLST